MTMRRDAGLVRVWVLAFVLSAGLGFAALIGIGCVIGANACPFRDDPVITSTDGRTIWLNRCAACHGIEGRGVEGAGPSLVTGPATDLTLQELREKIRRGRPFLGMPRFDGDLSPEQIDAAARYVLTLRGDEP